MSRTIRLLKILLLVIGITGCILGFILWDFLRFVNSLDECVMNIGPIYGNKVNLVDSISLEQEISIPNGKLGLIHLSDSLAPTLIKYNTQDSILWAIEFPEDSIVIPHSKLSQMRLNNSRYFS